MEVESENKNRWKESETHEERDLLARMRHREMRAKTGKPDLSTCMASLGAYMPPKHLKEGKRELIICGLARLGHDIPQIMR